MTEYSESKRKELETKKRLGPRLGQSREKVVRPGDFYGSSAPRRRVHGGGNGHPTRDAA